MTAGATDFLIPEGDHELAHHIREEHRICIAEEQDVVFRNLVQTVQHGGLACILRGLHQRNSLRFIAGDDFGGFVSRAVVTNQDFQLVLGVIEFQNILNLALNYRLFVVGRNKN